MSLFARVSGHGVFSVVNCCKLVSITQSPQCIEACYIIIPRLYLERSRSNLQFVTIIRSDPSAGAVMTHSCWEKEGYGATPLHSGALFSSRPFTGHIDENTPRLEKWPLKVPVIM
jgi:hypothetical protein